MASNRTILQKSSAGPFSVADLGDGGLLNEEQANRFVRKLIKQPTIIRDARVVEMNFSTRNINKIHFNKRIMRAATSGVALANAAVSADDAFDPTDAVEGLARAKVLTEQVQLVTKETIAQVNLPYDTVEDNIERGNVGQRTDVGGAGAGGGLIDTIMMLMAERAALDFEELALLGDDSLGAADTYLTLFDGWILRAEAGGNIVDVLGATVTKDIFKNAKKTMPDQYLRNLGDMRSYISMDQETEYRDTVASRGTGLGDATLQGDSLLRAFGTPIQPVQQMPEAKGLFVNPLNLLWGIQRRVLVEWEKDIESRVLKIVLTARVAVQVEEEEAIVVWNNIGS